MNDIWSALARYLASIDIVSIVLSIVFGGLGGAIFTACWQAHQKATDRKSLLKRLKVGTQANLKIMSDNKTIAKYSGLDRTSELMRNALSGKLKGPLPPDIFTPLPTTTYEEAHKEKYGFPEELMEPIHYYVPLATRLNYLWQQVELNPYKIKQDRALLIRLCEDMIAVLESIDNELDALLPQR